MCTWVESVSSVQSVHLTRMGSVQSADLYNLKRDRGWRSAWSARVDRCLSSIYWICMLCRICMIYLSVICVICMICTPEWGMYDLHDMHIFIGWSAWSAGSVISAGSVWSAGFWYDLEGLWNLGTSHLFTACRVGDGIYRRQIFHRCVPEWDLCDLYVFTGLDLYDLQDVYDLQYLHDLQNLYDL